MSISQEALFKIALNLEDPWYIKLIDFSVEGKQLDVHVDFESGSKFPCAKARASRAGSYTYWFQMAYRQAREEARAER